MLTATCRLLLGLLPPPSRCAAYSGRSSSLPAPPAAPLVMSAPSALIEVERKFAAATDAEAFQRQVELLGGQILGQKRFADVYYDTSDCTLTSQDIWLRARDGAWPLLEHISPPKHEREKHPIDGHGAWLTIVPRCFHLMAAHKTKRVRGRRRRHRPYSRRLSPSFLSTGAWELKLPLDDDTSGVPRSGGERTVFREVEGTAQVARELAALLPGADPVVSAVSADGSTDDSKQLEALLLAVDAKPFAQFETVRSRYRLGRCAIDADIASFGHSVLEIEVMCCSRDEVPEAEAEIEQVATLVGVQPLGDTGGKLETYIRRFCPAVLQKLVEAGVLPPSP